MSENASVVFLPWVRQGLAARIAVPDPLTTPLAAQAALGVALAINNAPAASMPVRLAGPGDVLGIDPRQVVRTEPPAGTIDYESNDLAAIEFDNPDLPWLFTPAAADAQGRVRPWLVLAVVKQQDGVRLRAPRDEPLPVLEIASPAVPANELPDLADSWAWAHAQLGAREGADANELGTLLATRPELSVSRLLSPRLLEPFTDYLACVVPAFDAGRRAGLGESFDANAPLQPAWTSGDARVTLPVYYRWEFRTAAREDFESMVDRLVPRDLAGEVGRRPMDIAAPGFTVPATIDPTVQLEGALQPVDAPRAAWPGDATRPWLDTLQSIVNAANARSAGTEVEPVLGPPIYGRWHAGRHEVGIVAQRHWLDHVNLDPRERVAAALGTRVIQQHQEALVAEAWQQAGEIARANQLLRQMQLSLAITTRLHARHVQRIDDDDTLWRLAAPAGARLVLPSGGAGGQPATLRSMLAQSSTPQVATSPAMRRLSRPRGAIARRAFTALRIAEGGGGGAGGDVRRPPVARLLPLFRGDRGTPLMIFTLPPTRGMVSFDSVTRRLGSAHAGIIWLRATDFRVASAPPQPGFVVNGEPIIVVGVLSGGALRDSTLHADFERARRQPNGGHEPPDPREPPEPPEPPPPHDPRPPPPPRIDSDDAKVFREAARRHLARVNPEQPWIFVPFDIRPALDVQAAQVRALLDPAPALRLRMAAMVRLGRDGSADGGGAGGEAPSAIGEVGCTPTFAQPMSEPLAALSQDWLLPGLEKVPPDTVALLEPNPRFIEAFMLGLNVEMSRELLWRDFPLRDERATYFRRFWRAVDARGEGDIAPIVEWADRALGRNGTTAEAKQVVLLVRSGLFRRYPNAVVYAVPAMRERGMRKPSNDASQERHALFRGSLQPDVSFFGFEIDPGEATADPGWYFVIQQQPTEPRFGFDVGVDFGGARFVPLGAVPVGHQVPEGAQWAFNSAQMARSTRQLPMRVAIHAGELIS